MVKRFSGWFLIGGVLLCACGGSDEGRPDTAEGIEIEGSWSSDFGSEVITEETWAMGETVSEIVEFSNDENAAVVLSPEDAEYDPGTWGRIVWTEPSGDSFFYCTVAYGKPSAEAAVEESEPADDEDPETGGCGAGGFPWTKLTRDE